LEWLGCQRLERLPKPLGYDEPPKSNPSDARLIQAAVWITDFAFSFIGEVARVRPDAKLGLRQAMERHNKLVQFFHFLGPACGFERLGLSRYYEDIGDRISGDWRDLLQKLK
jgi:hypothetical protein